MRFTPWITAAVMLPGLTSCYSPNETVVGTAADGTDGGSQPSSTGVGADTTVGTAEPTTDGPSSGPGESSSTGDAGETSPDGAPRVRVVHAADAGRLDVYVMGMAEPLAADLGFGESTDHVELPAGPVVLELRDAGAAPDSQPLFTSAPVDLAQDDSVTVVAAGVSGSADPELSLRALALTEAFGDPGAGRAAVRAVNLGIDAPAMDVDIGDDATPDVTGLPRFGDTGAGGDPVPAGAAVQLGVVVGESWPTAFTLPELAEGEGAFLLVAGEISRLPRESASMKIVVVDADGVAAVVNQNPVAHFFHAGIDTGPMDVCIGGEVVVAGFEFGEIAAQRLPPADYAIELHSAPSDCGGAALAADTTGMLVSGEQYLVIAHGEEVVEGSETQALAIDTIRDEFDLEAAPNVVTRFFNGLSAAPVQFGEMSGDYDLEEQNLWVASLAFSETSEQLTRAPGAYDIAITFDNIPLPADGFLFVPLAFGAGAREICVMAGNYVGVSNEPDDEYSRYFIVDTTDAPWTSTEILQL
jgi:hypothetical protein